MCTDLVNAEIAEIKPKQKKQVATDEKKSQLETRPGKSSAARRAAQAPLSNDHYAAPKTHPRQNNAWKIHHFKGYHKFRLRAAVKLFPGLLETMVL